MDESFGHYVIGELLGRGGMGEVHRAHDTAHDRVVALKRLSPALDDEEYRARFRREARIVARLREPHVIPIHAYGEIDGRLYLDMRLVEGQDLGELCAAAPLSPERAVRIVAQVAGALDAAHADGVVHRDVKPSNILVTPDDFAYLVDFGIARDLLPGGADATASGVLVGTLDYMAPERFAGGVVDGRADVYALACVLYACVTGQRPFPADGVAAQIWAHLHSAPPSASRTTPAVPAAVDDVIRRGMAKDPADRHQTAGAFAAAATAALTAPRRTRPSTPTGGPSTPAGQVSGPTGTRLGPPADQPGPHRSRPAPPIHHSGPTSGPLPRQSAPQVPPPQAPHAYQPSSPSAARRTRAPLIAGAVALVLIVGLVAWSASYWSTGNQAGATTTTTPAPTTSEADATTTERQTTTDRKPTTTTPQVSADEVTLRQRLPEVYRDNASCVTDPDRGTGATAGVVCTQADSAHPLFPPPQRAVFRLFADRAAQDAFFQGIVQANGIPRDDDWGGCRPKTQPPHYALYYRDTSGPLAGEFTTCFVKDGVGQVWWVDTRTSTVGGLLSSAATGPDELDKLGYWWNSMILVAMG
ncbi:serine/threonine-protein kinase [Actinosynnema sp. NPDC047251]|uniref:non-specific serine/threonine protein kinase n=1 Tax=Saccharothrix espanaensis (strain ATCC 51144 / DSM 44229 / JCM 9112 / NBRC 15066 / NRRL 15764) TaxID=1179773 RepID=K0JXH9_SACES|nr:serine/threonine-protein kinase [Saccharothrix espanaensis]CCH30821.1 Serine/threonine protein kinase [Saccharothrix espanaensis DSM 44229]